MEKILDKQTLSKNNGQDGKPIYIAQDGQVYDVSESKLWKGGRHMNRHDAGMDLTEDFADAPHGPEVFERFTLIGKLQRDTIDASPQKDLPPWLERLLKRYPLLARHPHPAQVHFPIAFFFAAPFFSLLALLLGSTSFESTAFHCLAAGTLTAPLTIASGFFTWWLNYDSHLMKQIRIKIIGSALLMLLALILFVWRYAVPDLIFSSTGSLRTIYLLLLLSLIPLVSVIGWNGATLTFPSGKK